MPLGGPCWAYTYDELNNEPACDPTWWPTTYDELRLGPPTFDEWLCWPETYEQLMSGPLCAPQPEPTPEMAPLVCPTRWPRASTGGAWQVIDEPSQDWAEGLLFVPLMHACSLEWGHIGDHYCGCTADYQKPGEEGWVTPPLETIDPITDGVLPEDDPLVTMPGGQVAAKLQPRVAVFAIDIDPDHLHQQRVDELSRILDGAADA